jgi:DNA repair protein RecN (Recombination protein N)
MLEELNVRNYALIENLSVTFENGLNILTGETGAGKSIIVGSLSFLLGGKADADVIRTGSEEAAVSAVISLREDNRDVREWLAARDISIEDNRVIVRRNIKSSGRSSMYIQDTPVTRNDLAECMGLLFDLHGQHSHESLLRKESHRKYLDRFAGLEDEVLRFGAAFTELTDLKKVYNASISSEKERETRLELLRYAVDEIEKAAVKSGEGRELESESQRLSSFEKLSAQINAAVSTFVEGESSVLSQARHARSAVENAASFDGDLNPLRQRMDSLFYEAEDLAEELRSYRDDLSYNPGRLEAVEERLALLQKLKKKYGADEDAVLAYRVDAEAEIDALANADENREKLAAEISGKEKDLARKAASLSAGRKDGGVKLGEQVTAILAALGMPNARFSVSIKPKRQEQGGGGMVIGPYGAEDVEFLISANAGEPLKDLSRIASGGELSRVMLAIKTVLAGADTLETLVFDEIDAGIGGEVALAVGEHLRKLGALKQIFCITHLATIAVRADNHLRVEKKATGGRTVTVLSVLKGDERRGEIARMLAGDSAGAAALAHADELLVKYTKPLN